MVTFDQAFANTKEATRLSIKTKLTARGYDLEGELDDSFMGLQEEQMKAAKLTDPETTALCFVLAKITGARDELNVIGRGHAAVAVSPFVLQLTPSSLKDPFKCAQVAQLEQPSGSHLRPFLAYRPAAAAPPLALSLADTALGEVQELFTAAMHPPPDDTPLRQEECQAVIDLMCMADVFGDGGGEKERLKHFTVAMRTFLGQSLMGRVVPGTSVIVDGALMDSRLGSQPIIVLEAKNEVGSSGDPYFQGQAYYQRFLLSNAQDVTFMQAVVRTSACPCLMMELLGPLLRVSGLASVRDVQVLCQPLTPYLHLLDVRNGDTPHMLLLGRVLRALKQSWQKLDAAHLSHIERLQQQQQQQQQQRAARPAAKRPRQQQPEQGPEPGDGENVQRCPKLVLPYPLRSRHGEVQQLELTGRPLPLYRCIAPDGTSEIVKYVADGRYGAAVHRAWAAKGLAPQLRDTRRLPGGILEVTMEDLREEGPGGGWCCLGLLPREERERWRGAVSQALEEAHKVAPDGAAAGSKSVHGDMRAANVMVRIAPDASTPPSRDCVRFVDFDRAGEEGQVLMPAFARPRCGTGSGNALMPAHDTKQWEEEWDEGLP